MSLGAYESIEAADRGRVNRHASPPALRLEWMAQDDLRSGAVDLRCRGFAEASLGISLRRSNLTYSISDTVSTSGSTRGFFIPVSTTTVGMSHSGGRWLSITRVCSCRCARHHQRLGEVLFILSYLDCCWCDILDGDACGFRYLLRGDFVCTSSYGHSG